MGKDSEGGRDDVGEQPAERPQGRNASQGAAQRSGWAAWDALEGMLRDEDGKVVR